MVKKTISSTKKVAVKKATKQKLKSKIKKPVAKKSAKTISKTKKTPSKSTVKKNKTIAKKKVATKRKLSNDSMELELPEFDFENSSTIPSTNPELPDLDSLFAELENDKTSLDNLNNELKNDFDDIDLIPEPPVRDPSDQLNLVPEQISKISQTNQIAEEVDLFKPKKKRFNLFRKHHKELKFVVPEVSEDIKEGFTEDTKDVEEIENSHIDREKARLENLKRKVDYDHRERISMLQEQEDGVNKRQTSVELKEAELEKRELDLSFKEKQMSELNSLEEKLENQRISNEYQKQKIAELKSELALKDASLKEKEIEIKKRESAVKELESVKARDFELTQENEDLYMKMTEEDSELSSLQEEIEAQKRNFEEKMLSLRIEEHHETNDSFEDIHKLINSCYIELSQKNIPRIKELYNEIRTKYVNEGKAVDTKKTLHNEILKLHRDIQNSF